MLVGGHGGFLFAFLLFGGWGGGEWVWRREKGRNEKGVLTGDKTELSLTVPITNSLAFLFTVLGDWWAEGKVISRGEFPYPVLDLSILLGRSGIGGVRAVKCGAVGLGVAETVLMMAFVRVNRYVGWDGVCVGRDCVVCAVEEYVACAWGRRGGFGLRVTVNGSGTMVRPE